MKKQCLRLKVGLRCWGKIYEQVNSTIDGELEISMSHRLGKVDNSNNY